MECNPHPSRPICYSSRVRTVASYRERGLNDVFKTVVLLVCLSADGAHHYSMMEACVAVIFLVHGVKVRDSNVAGAGKGLFAEIAYDLHPILKAANPGQIPCRQS